MGCSASLSEQRGSEAKSHDGLTPLQHASKHGELERVQSLVESKADLKDTKVDPPPLFLAAGGNHCSVVEYLVRTGKLNVNTQSNHLGGTALGNACRTAASSIYLDDHLKLVKFLLEQRADTSIKDLTGKTPLCYVAENGILDSVKLLFQAKADVNFPSENPPIILAARNRRLKAVEYLAKEANADLEICDSRGQYALHAACEFGASRDSGWMARKDVPLKIIEFLLDSGANVNSSNRRGETALFLCCSGYQTEKLEMINLLLENQADVSISSKRGDTPLITATKGINEKVVARLVQVPGIDLTAENNDRVSAFECAITDVNHKTFNRYTPEEKETPILRTLKMALKSRESKSNKGNGSEKGPVGNEEKGSEGSGKAINMGNETKQNIANPN